MPLKRQPNVVAIRKKPIKKDVACNLEKCEGDVWLFCALPREKRREL